MQLGWLAIAIVATVAYHVVLKVTPPAASPFLSLAVSYAAGALVFLVLYGCCSIAQASTSAWGS
jgi:hypothetical protein